MHPHSINQHFTRYNAAAACKQISTAVVKLNLKMATCQTLTVAIDDAQSKVQGVWILGGEVLQSKMTFLDLTFLFRWLRYKNRGEVVRGNEICMQRVKDVPHNVAQQKR